MTLAKVVGTVVASQRTQTGVVYRLVRLSRADGTIVGSPLVALDIVSSREGDLVLLAQGSSCRWTHETDGAPIDTLVIGIVDEVHRYGSLIYRPGWENCEGEHAN